MGPLTQTERPPPPEAATEGAAPASLRSRLRRVGATLGRLLRDRRPFDPYSLERRDPSVVRAFRELFEWLNNHYFRLRVEGREHVRPEPTLYVANHNGGIMGPDLSCTLGTLWGELGDDATLYCMAHDLAMRRVTPLGRVLQGVGAMRAAPENAAAVFARGGSVLVYPGGDLDAYRLSRHRDRVVFGERTGFVEVAREAGVPIVPIVAHGAHRSAFIFHEGAGLARWLGLGRWSRIRRFPLALALPWGLAAGPWVPYLPLPFPIRLRILEPTEVEPEEGPAAGRDRIVARMQQALDAMAAE